MGMKDRNYWIERAKDKVIWNAEQTDQAMKELMLIYDETANEVEDRIFVMYQKFAKDNELTPDQAKQLISGKEFSVWRKSLEGYLKDVSRDGANSKILLELNTLAMKSRINREEKLLAEVYRSMAEMAQDTETNLTEMLADVTTSNYYRSCYNLQVGMGVGFQVAKIDKTIIAALVAHPWAEKTFSKAIWDDVDEICDHARRAITRGFVAGHGAQKITKDLQEVTGKGRKVVERLVRTEYKFFANQGELLGYIENGIKKYVFMGGTEGVGACHCAFYSNKIIAVDKAEPGVNFPPLHPNCLCTVRAYFDNSILDNKDCVPLEDDITQEEWEDLFVVEREKSSKKNQSTSVDFAYVNSAAYKEKFQGITGNKKTDDQLCKQARKMLKHRNNSKYEDLCLIQAETGKVVASQRHSKVEYETNYDKALIRSIEKNKEHSLISLHNHPNNKLPSGSDLVSNGKHKYKLGLVICHDGSVFTYKAGKKPFTARLFDSTVDKYRNQPYNEDDEEKREKQAYIKALKQFERDYGVTWEERL